MTTHDILPVIPVARHDDEQRCSSTSEPLPGRDRGFISNLARRFHLHHRRAVECQQLQDEMNARQFNALLQKTLYDEAVQRSRKLSNATRIAAVRKSKNELNASCLRTLDCIEATTKESSAGCGRSTSDAPCMVKHAAAPVTDSSTAILTQQATLYHPLHHFVATRACGSLPPIHVCGAVGPLLMPESGRRLLRETAALALRRHPGTVETL